MSTPSERADEARRTIAERMREALNRNDGDGAGEAVRARLEHPAPTLVPARADLPPEGRLSLFVENAKAVQADVERVATFADLPARIADYLRHHNLPMRLVKARDEYLDSADWGKNLIEMREGRPEAGDPVGLTTAFAGIAETGTLLLASDTDHPTTLAFLPETAIVALPADRIARAYEDALHAFRASRPDMPRSVNMVTGPSRSGDIEQTLQLGAHGPKRLLVILVDEPSGEAPIEDVAPAPPAR